MISREESYRRLLDALAKKNERAFRLAVRLAVEEKTLAIAESNMRCTGIEITHVGVMWKFWADKVNL